MKIVIILSIFFLYLSVFAQDISLTITQSNLALIKEKRELTLKEGNNSIQLVDLPSQIDPTSIVFSFEKQSIKLKEYFYAYDLQSNQTLLEKSVGKTIRILHPEHGTVQGKLIAVHATTLVIQTSDGELRVITNYNNIQFIIERSELEDGLILNPTLVCYIESGSTSKTKTDFNYITSGLNWATEYTAVIDETEKQMSLNTRAAISNYSGKKYNNCKILLLAGELNRGPVLRHQGLINYQTMSDLSTASAESDFQQSTSFEYHSYRLDRTISLQDQQQKVLPLYPEANLDISKIYTYNHRKDPDGIDVMISAKNSKKNGFGKPLPAGDVRIYKQEKGDLLILGEDNISHIPADEEIELKIGQAFDIVAQREILERKREGKSSEKMKISINFRNRKNENIKIHVTEPVVRRGDYRILSTNIEASKKLADHIEFIVPVKSNQTNKLEFEILYNW